MPSLENKKYDFFNEELFELTFVKGLSFENIYQNLNSYSRYWDLYCQIKKIRKDDVVGQLGYEAAHKYYHQALSRLRQSKKYSGKIMAIKQQAEVGIYPIAGPSQIVLSNKVENITYDPDGNEIKRTKDVEVKTMQIERVQFASPISVNALKLAESTQKLTFDYFEDLQRAIRGEPTKKFQFHYLELAGKVKSLVLEVSEQMEELISCNASPEEIKEVNRKYQMVMKMTNLMNSVRSSEMQPFYAMSAIHEAGSKRATELSAVIANDRTMIDAGNIVLKKDDNVVTDQTNMRKALKEKGFESVERAMMETLIAAGAFVDKEVDDIERNTDGFDENQEVVIDGELEPTI